MVIRIDKLNQVHIKCRKVPYLENSQFRRFLIPKVLKSDGSKAQKYELAL